MLFHSRAQTSCYGRFREMINQCFEGERAVIFPSKGKKRIIRLFTNAEGTAGSKTIFIPENYQTTVQIDHGTVSHHYLWTPGQQDKLLADVTANDILWSLTDHLGTIRDIIQETSSGLVIPAHLIYDAYGNIISCIDSTGQGIDNPILFGYTGKVFDVDTKLQNNINRWYDAVVGWWLSTDPIGFKGNDTNLYRYVRYSPINSIDFNGFEGKPYWGQDIVIMVPAEIQTFPPINCRNPKRIPMHITTPEIQRQKTMVMEMRKALEECTSCDKDLQKKALANFDKLIQLAQYQSAGMHGIFPGRCIKWVNGMYCEIEALKNAGEDLQIPDIITLHSIWYPYTWPLIPPLYTDASTGTRIGNIANLGHAFIRVTLCKKYVFYLDRGNWGHIFDDSKIGWPETISSQGPEWKCLE